VRSLEFFLFGLVSIESSGRPESLTPLVSLSFLLGSSVSVESCLGIF
jgi:hypothetical protein